MPEARVPGRSRVSWFELFYDLVLVATVLHGNRLFEQTPSFATGAWLAITLIVLLSLWLPTTLAFNATRADWMLRRLLTLIQMAALVIASLSISRDSGLSDATGFVALGIAFACVAALYWLQGRSGVSPAGGSHVIARCTALAAVVCVAGSFVSDRSAPIWANPASFALGIAMTLALVPLFTVHLGRLAASNQLDRDHLAERMGQLVIIALGESFADLVLSLGDRDSIPNPMYVILTFAVVYAMWAIYFRTVLPAGVPAGPSRTRGWIAAHALLIFGAIGTAAGFSGLAIAPLGDPAVTLASSRLPLPLLYVMVGFVLLTWIAGGLDRRFLRVHVAAAGSLLLVVLVSVLVIRDQAVVMGMVGACIVLADAAVIAWMSRGRGPLSALLRPAVRDSS